jgi:radical SAM protein with 4Fe4S-binding SPASM domain
VPAELHPPLPTELQVEVTGACNLRCRMCVVRYAPAIGRREGALAYEDFIDLVDALPALRRVTLQGLGEPLLSPHLLDMVRHAAGHGIEVGFNTNGTLLGRTQAEELVDAGLGWLHVSLDGASAATYEDVRHGTGMTPRRGQFERVVGNLRGLVAVRAAHRAPRPRIQLVFVAMRRNVRELPDLVRLAADLGVEEVWVQNLSHTFSDTDGPGRYAPMREYAAQEALFDRGDAEAASMGRHAFAAARDAAERVGVGLRLPRLEPDRHARPRAVGEPGCSWPWDSSYVTHRGEVQPCCMVMGSDRATLGSIRERSFGEVWGGEEYRAFRRRLLGDDPPEVCRGCSAYRGLF